MPARKVKAPIVIDPSDLSPQDLGGGWKLLFQRMKSNPTKVRAIVRLPDGSVYAQGDVVDESNALASRMGAYSRAQRRTYYKTLGLGPDATEQQACDALVKQAIQMGALPPDYKDH